jgi:hypothetical protein
MILFVPGYDPATEANLVIAARLTGHYRLLLRENATREALLQSLESPGEPLFAMSHGRSDRLLAQEGRTALAEADTPTLGRRAVFSFACHTATELGRSAAQAGATWWGYTGTITAPDASTELLPFLVEIFTYLSEAFVTAVSTAARQAVLVQLGEHCHLAERKIDDLLETDPGLDAGTAYLCLLHLWDRLRIWEEGAETPLQHPEARPPFLFPAG